MGLFWFSQGLGSLLGTAVMYSFHNVWFFDWDDGDINCRVRRNGKLCVCHLDYYFFFLSGVQLVGIFVFMYITYKLDIGSGSPLRHSNKNGYVTVTANSPRGPQQPLDRGSVQIRQSARSPDRAYSVSSTNTDVSQIR